MQLTVDNLPPGEYTCQLCRKPYPEDDIKFVGNDPVCYECYEREGNKTSGRCGICGSPLKKSEKMQCYSCRRDSYTERENNLHGWLGEEKEKL